MSSNDNHPIIIFIKFHIVFRFYANANGNSGFINRTREKNGVKLYIVL